MNGNESQIVSSIQVKVLDSLLGDLATRKLGSVAADELCLDVARKIYREVVNGH